MSEKRTAGPWKYAVAHWASAGGIYIEAGGVEIATAETVEDASFIVRACNAHDELLAVVERYARNRVGSCQCAGGESPYAPCLPCMARAALKKARGL